MRSLTISRLSVAIYSLVFLAAATGCGQKADLRLHLKQGDKRTVHLTHTVAIKPTVAGQGMDIGSTTEFTCRFEIQEVNATGDANAKVTFEVADQNGYASMGGTTLPGSDAMTGGVGKALHAIQGDSFTCSLASDGKVTNVKGMEAIAKKAVDKMEFPAGGMSAMLKPMLTAQMNASLSNASMETLWTSVFSFYPGKPVRVNESWNSTSTVTGEGMGNIPISVVGKFTLKALQGTTATLESTSTVSSDAPSGGTAGIKIKDLKGTGTATIDVDVASGWIKKGNGAMTFGGSLEMPTGMAVGGGATPIAIDQKSSVESYAAS